MPTHVDGFWLPQALRAGIRLPAEDATMTMAGGRPSDPAAPGAVTARWPKLGRQQWHSLLARLTTQRQDTLRGRPFWQRLQDAFQTVGRRLADAADPLHAEALATLPAYTGYSEPMIRLMLGGMDMMTFDHLSAAFTLSPTRQAAVGWQTLSGLPGRLHFYARQPWRHSLWRLPAMGNSPLFTSLTPPQVVIGYGAGNVPGTALLMVILAQATALLGGPPPVIVVRNSRHEPIFTSLVLKGLEAADPAVVSTVALMIWDYDDTDVEETLLSQADLVIAAASDETIAQIAAAMERAERAPTPQTASRVHIRFHPHGHKVSFAVITGDALRRDLYEQEAGLPLFDMVSLLATLDSVFWDQHGCLSARIHFVQHGGDDMYTPLDYACRLNAHLRLLARLLPRGTWPRQQMRDAFDRYKLLETTTGLVHVLSTYDDDFLVAVDERPLTPSQWRSMVNDCQGRVIIVRPVTDLTEVPDRYLRWLPSHSLQSLSVACGQPGEELTPSLLRFADACGRQGVTALRTVGRGAFPQLAYSWDGLLPLDLVGRRPAGHFSTIEFDRPYDEMVATFKLLRRWGVASGLA